MSNEKSYLEGKRVLAVDDEEDVLATIEELLEHSDVDKALDYQTASEMIHKYRYDLAILDIMGVDGLKLLKECVEKGTPAIMLTAHAMNYDTLMASVRDGSIAFLPKDKMGELDQLLEDLMAAYSTGISTWKVLFDELGEYFIKHFGKKMAKVEWVCRSKGEKL
ncbi:MAG: response regulator [Deltaproteobacteria bacterium]|nr:response regulator [Deltaproteobacteria bacterium]